MGRPATIDIGFLSVRATGNGGLRGGYLLTTEYGRPIEFHYTGEIFVPPPQRVLYGNRFEPAVFGEVIGKALTDRQSRAPRLIAVNQAPSLELRRLIPAPVVLVVPDDGSFEPMPAEAPIDPGSLDPVTGEPVDSEVAPTIPLRRPWHLATHADFTGDLAAWHKLTTMLPPGFDWLEPFERLELALAEIRDPLAAAA